MKISLNFPIHNLQFKILVKVHMIVYVRALELKYWSWDYCTGQNVCESMPCSQFQCPGHWNWNGGVEIVTKYCTLTNRCELDCYILHSNALVHVLVRVYMCIIIYACTHNAFLCRCMWVCTYACTRQYCNLCACVHVNVYVSCSRMPHEGWEEGYAATTIFSAFEVYSRTFHTLSGHENTCPQWEKSRRVLQHWWGRAHCFWHGTALWRCDL